MIEPWAIFPRKTSLVSFGYTRDAAGRLAAVSWDERTGGRERFRNVYDWRGRRVRRVREGSADGGATWDVLETREFFYDDWNLVHETRTDEIGFVTQVDYFWGPDLSGSLQGAGGVGGLVAVSIDGDYYFLGYDNNGNVVGYWDESGSLVAEYAYDAFGNTISSSGSMASVFPHRFSTKYYDAETDLYYYGYRYYSPSLGRWISRDPIEEDGSLGLYSFCDNGSFCSVDVAGTTEPYDRIGIVLHGIWNESQKRPDGQVGMRNEDSIVSTYPRESFTRAMRESALLNSLADKIVVISCYQSWKEPQVRPGESEDDAISRASRDSKESPNIIAPDWKIGCHENGLYFNFQPFGFSRKYGDETEP